MIERLKSEGPLYDHELIEILLYNIIPRKNTNGTAHNLLKAFGTIEGIFQASYEQLLCVDGIGAGVAAYLRCIALCNERMRFAENLMPMQINFSSYSQFLIERFRGLKDEVLEVYALDSADRVRCVKRFQSMKPSRVDIDMFDFSYFITTNRPHGIILAHNHPNTSCEPSKDDDDFTKSINLFCSMHQVILLDHNVIGKDGCYSYFQNARLDGMKQEYNIGTILNRNK